MKTKIIKSGFVATNIVNKAKEDSKLIALEKRVRDLEELAPSFWEQLATIAVGIIFVASTWYSLYMIGGQLDRIRAVVSGNCLMTDAECTYFTN